MTIFVLYYIEIYNNIHITFSSCNSNVDMKVKMRHGNLVVKLKLSGAQVNLSARSVFRTSPIRRFIARRSIN